MSESVLAASDFSLETSWKQAEKGTLSPFECLSFANTIQADLPTCGCTIGVLTVITLLLKKLLTKLMRTTQCYDLQKSLH